MHPRPDHDNIAWPGDDDLACAIVGAKIAGVVVAERDVIVSLDGGVGTWRTASGERKTLSDGDLDAEITMTLATGPDAAFDSYVATLAGWRDSAEEVALFAAPGRLAVLIASSGQWLPVPTRRYPTVD